MSLATVPNKRFIGKIQDSFSHSHILRSTFVYLLTFLPVATILAIAVLQSETPFAYLTKDPLTVAEMTGAECCRVYYGAISNLGILLWCAASTACLFAALVLWLGRDPLNRRNSLASALLVAGLFSGWMTLDDLFLIHENVLPAIGVGQMLVYAMYALATAAYLVFAKDFILDGRLLMFALSISFLALSVGVDVIATSESFVHVLIEDGAKFLGIAAWASFHIEAAAFACREPEFG